eukprot:5951846-Amphidinium_carterae.2
MPSGPSHGPSEAAAAAAYCPLPIASSGFRLCSSMRITLNRRPSPSLEPKGYVQPVLDQGHGMGSIMT